MKYILTILFFFLSLNTFSTDGIGENNAEPRNCADLDNIVDTGRGTGVLVEDGKPGAGGGAVIQGNGAPGGIR